MYSIDPILLTFFSTIGGSPSYYLFLSVIIIFAITTALIRPFL